MVPNLKCHNDNYENYTINTYRYMCINVEHKPRQFISRTKDILAEWFRRCGPKPPPVVESDLQSWQLPNGSWTLEPKHETKVALGPCECGAHVTEFPNVHSFWCPAYTDNGAL
jgi:hypothetical protein